jgi:hypothetical protein
MKNFFLGAGILVVVLISGVLIWRYNTKAFSPENSFDFQEGNLKISVFYNRPFKKGRTIFGGLVPYGKTWRTGANEATVFETNTDLFINGKRLTKGRYSLWTVPDELSWKVVFNSTIPAWGIDVMNNGEAARDPAGDILIVEVPTVNTPKEFEQFTIAIDQSDDMLELILAWDKTLVAVPLSLNEQ